MKVLVCGSRAATSTAEGQLIYRVISALRPDVVVQGGARGVDEWARGWAEDANRQCVTYPADWESFGRAAGPKRNQLMLDDSKPDIVLAFPGGKGTADMVRRAKAGGYVVLQVVP